MSDSPTLSEKQEQRVGRRQHALIAIADHKPVVVGIHNGNGNGNGNATRHKKEIAARYPDLPLHVVSLRAFGWRTLKARLNVEPDATSTLSPTFEVVKVKRRLLVNA